MLLFVSLLFAEKKMLVELETTKGAILIKMLPDIAPKAVENFTTHVQNGYYDGVIFHRVIKDFMIQCGDPTGTGRGGESIWNRPFEDEFKPNVVFNRGGIVAMANRGRNTNGSQFFITVRPTPHLNGGYTIFGEVLEGFDVVKKIENVETGKHNRPLDEVKIIHATLKKEIHEKN